MTSKDHPPPPNPPRDPASSPAAESPDDTRHSPKSDGGFPFSLLPSPFSPGSRLGASLQAYFRSGWAFLIPYLAAYLLYAWLRWPVNPAVAGAGSEGQRAWSWVPCLLHVYWGLHVIHFVLGVTALRTWWKSSIPNLQLPTSTGASSAIRSTADRLLSTGYSLLPWLSLTLLFYLPGVYLEFPADTWAHFARISEWSSIQQVTLHSTWLKFSYFLGYTLVNGSSSALTSQFARLDVYNAGCCLLLCWQYCRLGGAVGLNRPTTLTFVLLQTLLLGNNAFGYYRYYGISSSPFGQLGAIAIVRIALETLSRRTEFRAAGEQPVGPTSIFYRTASIAGASILIIAFTYFNHRQALAIACLGVTAAGLWSLVRKKRALFVWLALGVACLSLAAVLWFPRDAALDYIYRPQGWLTTWYGFNLYGPGSPARDRMLMILGWAGVLNVLAGAALLHRNHIVSWLTLFPIVSLCLPFVAIPLANALSRHNADPANILTFHRLLFSIPPGLALVVLVSQFVAPTACRKRSDLKIQLAGFSMPPVPAYFVLVSTLVFTLTIPAGASGFNRFYHALVQAPDDLGPHMAIRILEPVVSQLPPIRSQSTIALGKLLYATRGETKENSGVRITSYISAIQPPVDFLAHFRYFPEDIFIPISGREFHTPVSFVGLLSGHWFPQIGATAAVGGPEFERKAFTLGYRKLDPAARTAYLHGAALDEP